MRALNKKQKVLLDEWFEKNKDDVGYFWDAESLDYDVYVELENIHNFEILHQAITGYIQEQLINYMADRDGKQYYVTDRDYEEEQYEEDNG